MPTSMSVTERKDESERTRERIDRGRRNKGDMCIVRIVTRA